MLQCPACGTNNDDRAVFCQRCGHSLESAKRVSFSAASEYAGFWRRLAAWVIDTVIVHAVTGMLIVGTFGVGVIAVFLLPWVYEAFLQSSEWQATVGKRVLGLVVTDLKEERISFMRATGRHFAKYISAFLLGIGFIMAAFTARKQALHDMIADTLVVAKDLPS
jgi:uncharacterized RDD family membrane protein YckC